MTILIPYSDPGGLAERLARQTAAILMPVETRRFPDGESYIRCTGDVTGRQVCIVAAPLTDEAVPGLWFLCDLVRRKGAQSITFLIPYLPYMRQDIAFQEGEAVSARSFSSLLSLMADRIITVDPHLHRIPSLDTVFNIPTVALHASDLLSEYIRIHIPDALVIGPDSESEQWAASVAEGAGVPYIVCQKVRSGDREVEISGRIPSAYLDRTPVLVDDVISTGRTLGKAAALLISRGMKAPVCMAVHGLFSGDALSHLTASGISRIITTNSIPNPTSSLDITPLIAPALL